MGVKIDRKDAIEIIEDSLEKVKKGKMQKIETAGFPEDLMSLSDSINEIQSMLAEVIDFARSISNGEYDADPPDRNNYLAAPLKEIHSQLASMTLNIKDLAEDKMVCKLYYPGELFENYNALIKRVTDLLNEKDKASNYENNNVSSWTFHQVLSAINQLSTMVVQYDNNGHLVFANVIARQSLKDIEQLTDNFSDSDPNTLKRYMCQFIPAIKDKDLHELISLEFPIRGEIYDEHYDKWFRIQSDIARLPDGYFGIIHMIDDVTDWKDREDELKTVANTDPLTSTYTRKAGDRKLKELVENRINIKSCIAFIDIDGLKSINDRHGHNEGDFTIKTIASVLMSGSRDSDWVIRFGGDEFILLFENCSEDVAEKIVGRMHDELESINDAINKPYKLSFSSGLSAITEDMDDVEKLIKSIDEKMYKNKKSKESKS